MTTVRYDFHPDLNRPILIEGLPGIGNVGKIAADYLCEKLDAKKFASVYSESFPPLVLPDNDCVVHMACNELWYAKAPNGQDIIFLKGDYQGSTPEGQFILAQDVMEILLSYGVSRIITLGGYGTGKIDRELHVFGAVTRAELKEEMEKCGVTFNPGEPRDGIVGAAGLFLGFAQLNGIDGLCLMGETSGFFVDHGSSIKILEVLGKMFSVEDLDLGELQEKSEQLNVLTEKANQQVPDSRDDLNYIG